MARDGDTGHQISDYRGLAKRQPLLALGSPTLLLGQAGVPFTTGFLAKFGVVGASVATHAYVLAAVAMVSAAIAAFFYLRVVVTMYSPVGLVGDTVGRGGEEPTEKTTEEAQEETQAYDAESGKGASTASFDEVSSLLTLTDAPPTPSVTDRGVVAVPWMTSVVIGCLGGVHRGVRDRSGAHPGLRPPGNSALHLISG